MSNFASTKAKANKLADSERAKGRNARVVGTGKNTRTTNRVYIVYTRKAGQ